MKQIVDHPSETGCLGCIDAALFVGLGENPEGFSGPKLALTCGG